MTRRGGFPSGNNNKGPRLQSLAARCMCRTDKNAVAPLIVEAVWGFVFCYF